jgi:hypothetical protein
MTKTTNHYKSMGIMKSASNKRGNETGEGFTSIKIKQTSKVQQWKGYIEDDTQIDTYAADATRR